MWTVIDQDAGIFSTGYRFNDRGGQANSLAMRINPDEMVVFSAPAGVNEPGWAQLEEYGKVVGIVAPNGFHHLGIANCRERHPEARWFAPELAQDRISNKGEGVDGIRWESIAALQEIMGPDVGVTSAPETKCGETWAWAKTADGNVMYASDVVCNWETFPGNFLLSFMWKMSGSGPGFRPFHFAMLAIAKNKKAVFSACLDDIEAHPPNVILPGHGATLKHDGLAGEARSLFAEAAGR